MLENSNKILNELLYLKQKRKGWKAGTGISAWS